MESLYFDISRRSDSKNVPKCHSDDVHFRAYRNGTNETMRTLVPMVYGSSQHTEELLLSRSGCVWNVYRTFEAA